MDPGSHVGFQISTKNTNLVEDHPVNISGFKSECNNGTKLDYFSRKSLSKYLMNTIDFNKHNVDINGTRKKYAGNIG
jgi:hypothetical protein